MIQKILWLVYGYILVFLTGGTLLMTLFVAPSLFAHLDPARAGQAVGALFPGYFHLLFTGAMVEAVLLAAFSKLSSKPVSGLLLWGWVAGLGLSALLALVLGPHALELKRLRDQLPGDPVRAAAFDAAHRETFLVNLALLIGLLAATLSLLSRSASSPVPRRSPGETRPENPA